MYDVRTHWKGIVDVSKNDCIIIIIEYQREYDMKAMKNCVLVNELLSLSVYSLIAYIVLMKIIFQVLNNNLKLYFQYIGIHRSTFCESIEISSNFISCLITVEHRISNKSKIIMPWRYREKENNDWLHSIAKLHSIRHSFIFLHFVFCIALQVTAVHMTSSFSTFIRQMPIETLKKFLDFWCKPQNKKTFRFDSLSFVEIMQNR